MELKFNKKNNSSDCTQLNWQRQQRVDSRVKSR